MSASPGEVYIVDLGMVAKERPMLVASRHDPDAPRALVLCVPLTTRFRGSRYEVDLDRCAGLRERSWANVQGLMAVGSEKLVRRIGTVSPAQLEGIRGALRFALDL